MEFCYEWFESQLPDVNLFTNLYRVQVNVVFQA